MLLDVLARIDATFDRAVDLFRLKGAFRRGRSGQIRLVGKKNLPPLFPARARRVFFDLPKRCTAISAD